MIIPNSNFYLKLPSATEPTLISLQLKFQGYRVNISTGEKIHPKKWDFIKHRAIGSENADLNHWLNKISGEVSTLFRNFNIDNITPTAELVTEKLREKLDNTPVHAKDVVPKLTLVKFIEQFIEESKTVKKPETVKAYKSTLNHLLNYAKLYRKQIDFDDIDMAFYCSFSDYISKDLGNSKNTVAKQIKTIKTFLNEATDRGYNANMTYKNKSFKKVVETVDKIYLTKNEIQRINNLDLSATKTREIARDLFVLSCYTGLRFSDFTRIKKEDIKDGMLHIRTTKTDQLVVIPIAATVTQILKKYNYNLPNDEISNQKMNEFLKDIGELAGIDEPVTITKTKAGERLREVFKKHELITAHCGRRSFATNAYKENMPAISIMKITGHTSEKAFLGYIRISQEENAQLIKDHAFFKS